MNTQMKKKPLFSLSLLSISLLLTSSGSIATTVSKMQDSFDGYSNTAVEALVTASNISVMVFVLLSAFLVKILGTKKTVILGLLLAGIGGVFPMFSDNYVLVYASRLVLGAGLGMFNSLAVSLIDAFYEGDQRQKMLGYQSAVQSIGQTVTTFIAGILVNFNWHLAYSIYFLAILSLVLFYFNIPETENVSEDIGEKTTQRVTMRALISALGLVIVFIFQMAINIKATALVEGNGIANPGFLGTALSLFTLVSFIGSLFYGNIVKRTRQFTLPIIFLIMAIGFFIISNAGTMAVLSAGLVLFGMGWSLCLPYAFGKIMENAPSGSENLSLSIAMVGCNLGCYISPFVLAMLGNLFGNTSAAFAMFSGGVCFLGAMIVTFLLSFKGFDKTKVTLKSPKQIND